MVEMIFERQPGVFCGGYGGAYSGSRRWGTKSGVDLAESTAERSTAPSSPVERGRCCSSPAAPSEDATAERREERSGESEILLCCGMAEDPSRVLETRGSRIPTTPHPHRSSDPISAPHAHQPNPVEELTLLLVVILSSFSIRNIRHA